MQGHPSVASRRYGINNKVAALFILLVLLFFGNQLVAYRIYQHLEGLEADINAAGRLRYLSQQTDSALLRAVLFQSWDSGAEELIAEFDASLAKLEGRAVKIGDRHNLPTVRLASALAALREAWPAYRADALALLETRPTQAKSAAQLSRLEKGSYVVLAKADLVTSTLSELAEVTKQQGLTLMKWLGAIDLAVLLAAFLLMRKQIVTPLNRLAESTRQFASGDYGTRNGFRSSDEIGQVSEAFDHMAETTQKHIGIIASDLEEIRQQQSDLMKLSKAVEHSPASVVITDKNAIIQYVNPAFTEATGYSFSDAVGQNPRILQSGKTKPETYQDLWRTILAGGIWQGELLNRKKNGEVFWEDTRISSATNERGEITHFIAVKEDVTKRKQTELELQSVNANLERHVAARTRALEDAYVEQEAFSYSVSHDLRTPLRAINGFAHAIKEDCAGCSRTESLEYMQRIADASIRMGQIIDDLLALGQVAKSEMRPDKVDLSKMARAIAEELQRHEAGRKVEFEIPDDIIVEGDARLLRIMLDNLLGNAWKYTAKKEAARISLGTLQAGTRQVVFVRDNGAGFSMNYAIKLFKPFQRLHNISDFPGSGIGLAIVHRIVTRMGGHVWAEAETGKGATFFFSLHNAGDAMSGSDPRESIPTYGAI